MRIALRQFICAPLLSSHGFTSRALLLAILFAVCEFAGWRDYTAFVSGTATSGEAGIDSSVTFGLIYMLAYFGFVLATPVLLLAAMILSIWQRLPRPTHPNRSSKM